MKLRNVLGALTLAIVPAIAASGQLTTTENPFPETGQQEDDVVFRTSTRVGVIGVITQRVSRASHSPSYFFFRIQATQGGVKTDWAIRVEPDPRILNFARSVCRDCLINEYPPEILQSFDIGKTVIVRGYQSRKTGDNRLLAKLGNISFVSPH